MLRGLRLQDLDRGFGIDPPQLMLFEILLDDVVGAVALSTRLDGFVRRFCGGKDNPFAILRPLKLIDIGLGFREGPRFAAIGGDQPNLLCRRLGRIRGALAAVF